MATKKSDENERAQFLKDAREVLERKRQELSNVLSSSFDDMREGDNSELTNSDYDDMGSTVDTDTAYRLMELGSVEIEEIDRALQRMDAGTYGLCEECDAQINIERLKALPFTPMCINCKRLSESSQDNDY